jgi:hypothetical protein
MRWELEAFSRNVVIFFLMIPGSMGVQSNCLLFAWGNSL